MSLCFFPPCRPRPGGVGLGLGPTEVVPLQALLASEDARDSLTVEKQELQSLVVAHQIKVVSVRHKVSSRSSSTTGLLTTSFRDLNYS